MFYKISFIKKLMFLLFLFQIAIFSQPIWQQTNGPFGGQVREITAATNGDLYITSSPGPYYSNDNGANWILRNNGINSLFNISISPSGDIFGTSGLHIYRSTDSGINWIEIDNNLSGYSFRFIIVTPNGSIFVSTQMGSTFSLYRSTDNGDSWIEVYNGITSTLITSLSFNSA